MTQTGKLSSKRSKPSYAMAVLGVALVLFLLGIAGLLVIQANNLKVHFKESIEIQVILRDNIRQQDAMALEDTISRLPFTKSVSYVSKDQALAKYKKDFGDDPDTLLQYNPLYSSIDFYARASYVNADSLHNIEDYLTSKDIVRQVYYQKNLVKTLNGNVKRVSAVILALGIMLAMVVIILIDNTIRLAMFSNRFLIKTMQMVGATRWFIAKPFDLRSIWNGMISGLLAISGLVTVIYLVEKNIPEFNSVQNIFLIFLLFSGILILGICISLLSTHRSVMKYLRLQLDELY
ncbi:MAG TPA: permease-like cell division protein FtsX [Chitinophagaceae bacterium]|nr:permease-like cell division protein FtsX [Chitinophagaceae bacterium]